MILDKLTGQKDTTSPTQNSGFMIRMVTSYSIFLLIILLLGIFLYSSALDNMKNRLQDQNQILLSNSSQGIDSYIDIMDVMSRQMLQSPSFLRLTGYTSSVRSDFLTDGYEVRKSLANNIYPDVLLPLNEFFLYFENCGYILSPNIFTARSLYYSGIKQYEPDYYESWLNLLNNEDAYNRMNLMDSYISVPNNHYYLYIVDLDELTFRKTSTLVCFVIDEKKLLNTFQNIDLYDKGFLVICDSEGNVMFSHSALSSEDAPAINISSLSSIDYEDGFGQYSYDGTNMLVTKITSLKNDWVYYLAQPEYSVYQGLNAYKTIYQLVLLVAVLLGMSMIYLFARQNVKPIVALGNELKDAKEVQTQMQEVMDKQKPILTNSYVRQLMLGTISSPSEMDYIKSFLELGGDNLRYNVVYVVAYNNSESTTDTGTSPALSLEEFDECMQHALRTYFGTPSYCYSPSERTYALLTVCNASEEDSLIMSVQDSVVKMHEYLLENYSIWMFAGIGKATDSMMHVWEAYQQAVEAISYTSKNYIFFPYEIIKKDSNVFYYPPELSTKLTHFITTGNKAQVLELFELIHQENMVDRSLPINMLKFLLSDIRNSLLKARFALPVSTNSEVIASLEERFNDHLSYKLCEDLAMQLCELFGTETADNSLIETIEKYINENYKDPSMCLNKISDEFQISESYFSHMFKEKTGVNFSVYLENIRMNEAAKLIQNTDMNLSDLYIAIGYNNPNTFRRAFKKIYGVTPSSMRETNLIERN